MPDEAKGGTSPLIINRRREKIIVFVQSVNTVDSLIHLAEKTNLTLILQQLLDHADASERATSLISSRQSSMPNLPKGKILMHEKKLV